MVDVVNHTDTILDVYESLERLDDVRLSIVFQDEADKFLIIPSSLKYINGLVASSKHLIQQIFRGEVVPSYDDVPGILVDDVCLEAPLSF